MDGNVVKILATSALGPGEEIRISYGERGNEELMFQYGFCEDGNARDALLVDLGALGREARAGSREEAFDLYASRYWALRTLWETDHEGESPIADPDLAMVEPEHQDQMSAPRLRGMSLPPELLRSFYRDAARDFAAKLPSA